MPHIAANAEEIPLGKTIQYQDGVLTVKLPKQLDVHAMALLWAPCMARLAAYRPKQLQLDASHVVYCDGAGAELIIALMAKQRTWKGSTDVHGLLSKGQDLLAFMSGLPAPKLSPKAKTKLWLVRVGQATSMCYKAFEVWVTFLGQVLVMLGRFCRNPGKLPWRDAWSVVAAVGPDAWPIVALMGVLFGLILGFQSLIALQQFGAQIYVANLVGVAMMRELAPLMTAVILIGRSGSAFAAELGGMTINQEVDALQTMAIDPVHFLVLPRVLATTLMMPCMTLLLLFFSLIGCGVVMHLLGYSTSLYIMQLQQALTLSDLLTGLVNRLFPKPSLRCP